MAPRHVPIGQTLGGGGNGVGWWGYGGGCRGEDEGGVPCEGVAEAAEGRNSDVMQQAVGKYAAPVLRGTKGVPSNGV